MFDMRGRVDKMEVGGRTSKKDDCLKSNINDKVILTMIMND